MRALLFCRAASICDYWDWWEARQGTAKVQERCFGCFVSFDTGARLDLPLCSSFVLDDSI